MSSDLIERLRALAESLEGDDWEHPLLSREACLEAADVLQAANERNAELEERAMVLQLPWPPSMNTYWRNTPRGTLLSAKGRQYREDVVAAVLEQHTGHKPLVGRLRVEIVAMPPDCRKRDLDNLFKGPLDAMEHAGVYVNDGQIDDLHIRRGDVISGGHLVVFVNEATSR